MILEEIRLKNFRCFYGDCHIELSTEPDKNITLIHSENGVGKTTILNALLWCFYNKTTRRFEKKNDIVNYQALREGHNVATVEIYFEHDGGDYVAKRHYDHADPSTQHTLRIGTREGGRENPHPTPDAFINSVIPKDMAGHFLFDGEHAEAISGEANSDAVGRAVRDILGCTLGAEAVSDLDAALKHYKKHAANAASGGNEIEELRNREKEFDKQIEQAKGQVEDLEQEAKSVALQMEDIQKYLRDSAAAKEIQKTREALERQLDSAEKREKKHHGEMLNWLGDNGHYLVAKKITSETFACLDDEATKGKVPAPYDKDFVAGLLEAEECVCGRILKKGGVEAEKVASLLETASSKTLIDRVIKVRSRLESLKREKNRAPQKLIDANESCSTERAEIERLEAMIKECSDKLKGGSIDAIGKKERKFQELRSRDREVSETIGSLKRNILNAEREAKDIDRQVDQITAKSEEAQRYILRRNLSEALRSRLENRLNEEEKAARKVIRASIAKIIDKTSRKDFKVRISESYTVSLLDTNGNTMPKSEGENQLLGLAFTAALCEFAKVRKNARMDILLPGTEAPLVLDSPFGKLDSVYKRATAEFLPAMARQVILMVSKEQGTENVISAIKDRVGKEYCLIRHNQSERGGKEEEIIDIGDQRIPITLYEAEYDGTEVRGVGDNV